MTERNSWAGVVCAGALLAGGVLAHTCRKRGLAPVAFLGCLGGLGFVAAPYLSVVHQCTDQVSVAGESRAPNMGRWAANEVYRLGTRGPVDTLRPVVSAPQGTAVIPVSQTRKHSDDPDPSFFGEELGSWDGDALVIDSIGFKDEQVWADENGSPHSDALHVVERWTRPDFDHLHVDTLIEDSKFYTQPFHYARRWELGKPAEELAEYACSENNVDAAHLGFGPGPIRPDGTRGYIDPAPLPPPLPRK